MISILIFLFQIIYGGNRSLGLPIYLSVFLYIALTVSAMHLVARKRRSCPALEEYIDLSRWHTRTLVDTLESLERVKEIYDVILSKCTDN